MLILTPPRTLRRAERHENAKRVQVSDASLHAVLTQRRRPSILIDSRALMAVQPLRFNQDLQDTYPNPPAMESTI